MIGRVLRPADGKTDAIVIDHSGAVCRHGFVEDAVEWTLDPDTKADTPAHKSHKDGTTDRLKDCPKCQAVMIAGKPCFSCGFMPAPRAEAIVFADGELGEVGVGRVGHAHVHTAQERHAWHGMLEAIRIERSYNKGWERHKYREKFNTWPAWGSPQPIDPTPEVRSWVKSRMIAYAKAKNRDARPPDEFLRRDAGNSRTFRHKTLTKYAMRYERSMPRMPGLRRRPGQHEIQDQGAMGPADN